MASVKLSPAQQKVVARVLRAALQGEQYPTTGREHRSLQIAYEKVQNAGIRGEGGSKQYNFTKQNAMDLIEQAAARQGVWANTLSP